MKNDLFYKYCVDKSLIANLGLEFDWVTKITSNYIWFTVDDKKYTISIDINYKDESLEIFLSLEPTHSIMVRWEIITIRNITNDAGFEKFRALLKTYLAGPIEVSM